MATDKYAGATPGPWRAGSAPSQISDLFSDGDYEIYPPPGEAGPVAIAAGKANAVLLADAWTLAAENAELRAALDCIADMIDNCADVPRNPDSLPMMVLAVARAPLARKEPGR